MPFFTNISFIMLDDISLLIPEAILIEILSYIPKGGYLPIISVSRRFRNVWLLSQTDTIPRELSTNPWDRGNLFSTPWFKPYSALNLRMLQFYIEMGWDVKRHISRLFRECSSRGDTMGLQFLVDHGIGLPDNREYCTLASAAGHLEALLWLRAEGCPWDPVEVYQEAVDNWQTPILDYIEMKWRGRFDAQQCIGYALP
jgi:hypothetical protein